MLKHIIASRFLCMPCGLDSITKEDVEYYVSIFEKYTLRSLNNLKNRDFQYVLLFHSDKDLSFVKDMLPAAVDAGATLMRFDRFGEFVERNRQLYDNLIVTRVDADDLFGNWLVDEVQEFSLNVDRSSVFGYASSLFYRIGSGVLRKHEVPYRNVGTFSCFQSVIYKDDSRLENLTPYMFNHSDLRNEFASRGISAEELESMIHFGDESKFPYVWMRNNRNVTKDRDPSKDSRFPSVGFIMPQQTLDWYGVELPLETPCNQ